MVNAGDNLEPGDCPKPTRNLSERTCVGCRRKGGRSKLLRYVAADGALILDERRRLPGRGAWLHDNPECMQSAISRRAFVRAGLALTQGGVPRAVSA